MPRFRVKRSGLIVGTVEDSISSSALRKAIEEYGPDVQIEEDVDNDLVEQEGTRDVRLMRSYRTKMFYVPRQQLEKEMNNWLSTIDVVIHNVQVYPHYEERAPHHYLTAIVLYSCPAETTAYRSVSEKLLTNPNALKEVIAMLPDEKLFLFASALKAEWSMYPDRDETRRNVINGIITAIASPVSPKLSEDVKRARMLISTPFTRSDVDVVRARSPWVVVKSTKVNEEKRLSEILQEANIPTIEEWCDQMDYLFAVLAQYGITT